MTLDKDFSDIRAYPPSRFAGLVRAVEDTDLQGQLWIVEEARIRVRD